MIRGCKALRCMRGLINQPFQSVSLRCHSAREQGGRKGKGRSFAGESRKRKQAQVDRRTLSLNFLDEQVHRRLLMKHEDAGISIAPCSKVFCMESKICWCGFPVQLEERDWDKLFSLKPNLMKLVRSQETDLFKKYVLPEGLKVMHVSGRKAVERAVHLLAESMKDPVVAIDMEWAGRHRPVGVIQVASSTLCVIIRARKYWKDKFFPPHLARLLSNPSVITLGFAWKSADEVKMKKTFNWGRSNFSKFVDLQDMAKDLGYGNQIGLADLTEKVTGTPIPKDINIQRSDWEAERLRRPQVLYAALDVFAAGQVFRMLRAQHAMDKENCPGCNIPLGQVLLNHTVECQEPGCSKTFKRPLDYRSHAAAQNHLFRDPICSSCGRMVLSGDAPTIQNTVSLTLGNNT